MNRAEGDAFRPDRSLPAIMKVGSTPAQTPSRSQRRR